MPEARVLVGTPAPDAVLYSTTGEPVRTSSLWQDGPVVIAFLRHFGCAFCKDQLSQLREEHTRIVEAGATVAAVVMGPPGGAGTFCADRALPFGCYADPDRSAYRAFALAKGTIRQWFLNRRVLGRGLRLIRRGVSTGLPHPGQDIRQMPGVFVVGRGGIVRLAHYHADASDNPPTAAILGALGA